MKEIVKNALGHIAVDIEGDPDGRLWGYYAKYGEKPNSTDELLMVTDKAPSYSTNNVVQVRVKELGGAYMVEEARWIDSTNLAEEKIAGEWKTIDDIEE